MTRRGALLAAALCALAACDRILPQRADLTLPPIAEIEAIYERNGLTNGRFGFNGNVVEITVPQPADQLQRGGSLWARVGPYIYLFTPATREVFDTWEGVAGVRVITRVAQGAEIARARLDRGRLDDVRWARALNILGHALRAGTERPTLIEDLVNWGEEYTEYRYNPEYVPRGTTR
jgi:hypothetical protein